MSGFWRALTVLAVGLGGLALGAVALRQPQIGRYQLHHPPDGAIFYRVDTATGAFEVLSPHPDVLRDGRGRDALTDVLGRLRYTVVVEVPGPRADK